jgi:hypothetical protein
LCETAEALGDMPIKYWDGDVWPEGACHFRGPCEDVEMGGFYIPEAGITKETTTFFEGRNQGLLAAKCQDLASLTNSLVLYLFMVDGGDWALGDVTEMFNAITGWDYSTGDLLEAGERGFTVQRSTQPQAAFPSWSAPMPLGHAKSSNSLGRRKHPVLTVSCLPPLSIRCRRQTNFSSTSAWSTTRLASRSCSITTLDEPAST